MHFLAQLADGVIPVAVFVFAIHRRQHFAERRIFFDVLLKPHQLFHQQLHFGRCFRRGKQEQNRVQVTFLRHDAILAQIVRQNGRRYAELRVFTAGSINARRSQQQLARINEILFFGITVEGVPAFTRHKIKETHIVGHFIGFMILPAFAADGWGNER